MAFSSMAFLFAFLPLCLLCYFLIPARFRAGRNFVLLVFSLMFLAAGGYLLSMGGVSYQDVNIYRILVLGAFFNAVLQVVYTLLL